MDSTKEEMATVEVTETNPSTTSRRKFQMPPLYEKPTLSQPGRILGIRRKWFLIGAGIFVVFIIVLSVGIGVGIKHKKKAPFLPLPGNEKSYQGDATYYGTGLGACGITSKDTDYIVAVSHFLWDAEMTGSNPNANPLCGRKIRATRYKANNEAYNIGAPGAKNEPGGENVSVDVTVVDRCVGCKSTDLDFSPSAFDRLADESMGRVLITWAWL